MLPLPLPLSRLALGRSRLRPSFLCGIYCRVEAAVDLGLVMTVALTYFSYSRLVQAEGADLTSMKGRDCQEEVVDHSLFNSK